MEITICNAFIGVFFIVSMCFPTMAQNNATTTIPTTQNALSTIPSTSQEDHVNSTPPSTSNTQVEDIKGNVSASVVSSAPGIDFTMETTSPEYLHTAGAGNRTSADPDTMPRTVKTHITQRPSSDQNFQNESVSEPVTIPVVEYSPTSSLSDGSTDNGK